MHVAAIIAAGGRGERVGAGRPKQLLMLGGRPVLERSVETFVGSDRIDEIVVVLPPDVASDPPAYLRGTPKPVRVVAGGARRQDSVAIGFDAASDRAEIVVVHDAARPFVTSELIARTIEGARASGAAIPALNVSDTVKEVRQGPGPERFVLRTLPREAIVLVQTPQAFRTDVLRDAIALGRRGAGVTDEASLAELAGHQVLIVEGDPANIKITTPDDLADARAIFARGDVGGPPPMLRVGTGYDLHRLVAGRKLVLGGVVIPFERGLDGHSDADALCHAIIDAILGAAAAGDIGCHFPNADNLWKDASSLDLLRRAGEIVRSRGFAVENVDAVVLAERPLLAPYCGAITVAIAAALDLAPSSVGVKGKTNEGVGEIGRGEAIAVHAVALLRSRS